MGWDRITILVDKIKDGLDKDGYVSFLCFQLSFPDCLTGTSKSMKIVQMLKRFKLVLSVQIVWTIWIEPMSYKLLLPNGPSTSNYENWLFCLLMIVLIIMRQSSRISVKVRNDRPFWWLICLTLSISVG